MTTLPHPGDAGVGLFIVYSNHEDKMPYYATSGDSSRFTVAAFDTEADRSRWMGSQADVRPITQQEARRLLDWDNHTPFRTNVGCYLGSVCEVEDSSNCEDARLLASFDVMRFCNPPIRL